MILAAPRVVAVDEEVRPLQVRVACQAKPSDHGHPTVVAGQVDEVLAPEVVVEMDLVPVLGQARDAIVGGLDPDGVGILGQEDLGARGVVIQEKDASRLAWARRRVPGGNLR